MGCFPALGVSGRVSSTNLLKEAMSFLLAAALVALAVFQFLKILLMVFIIYLSVCTHGFIVNGVTYALLYPRVPIRGAAGVSRNPLARLKVRP